VKFFVAQGSAHAVDLDDDEAELGESLGVAASGGKGARANAAALWAGIDGIDDGILL
jgi:hypothetical protein